MLALALWKAGKRAPNTRDNTRIELKILILVGIKQIVVPQEFFSEPYKIRAESQNDQNCTANKGSCDGYYLSVILSALSCSYYEIPKGYQK